MNIRRDTTRWIVLASIWLVLAFVSTSCASTDQQGYDENYGDNFGNNYGGEGNSDEGNNASANEGNDYAEEGEGNNYSEGVNNESYNEFENGEQVALQNEGNKAATDEGYGEYTNNAEESPDDLLANNSGLNLSGNTANPAVDAEAAPVNAAVDAPALDAPVNVAAPMPSSGGIVKYIRETTNILNSPNGQMVGTASRGEHPVVWDEGNFHRDSRGRYIPSTALSPSGVGRPRDGGSWRSGGG
jgi:hypothetical protein